MADTTKISELTPAAQLNNTDLLILTQGTAGSYASLNTTLLALASKIVANINYTSDLHTNSKTIVGALNEIFNSGNLADTYDTTETYEEDDYCIYQGLLYKCIAQTTGEFDTDDWVQTTITDELAQGGGGGGTTVIANPTGTPTDDLNSIQIGNDIYRIVGSGGGGGLTKTTLYENASGSLESVISLSQSIEDFDFVEIVTQYPHSDDNDYKQNAIYNTEELIDSIGTTRPINWHIGNDSIYTWIYITDVDEFTVHTNTQANLGIRYVYGYKVASGGSASWTDITGTLVAGQTEITLYGDVDSDSSIDVYTDKFGVNPTNIELGEGGFRLLQNLVSQESELDCTCTASSNFEANPPWAAFSSVSNAGWVANGNGNPTWWKVDFGEEVGLKKVEYDSADSNRKQTLSGIQYSDDGITWNDCTLSSNEYGEAILETRVVARYFKIYWTETYGFSTYPMLTALAMYDYSSTEITLTFPVQSENLGVKVRVS